MKKQMLTLGLCLLVLMGSLTARGEVSVTLAGALRFLRPETMETVEIGADEREEGLVYRAISADVELSIRAWGPCDETLQGALALYQAKPGASKASIEDNGAIRYAFCSVQSARYARFLLEKADTQVEFCFEPLSAEGEAQIERILKSVRSAE